MSENAAPSPVDTAGAAARPPEARILPEGVAFCSFDDFAKIRLAAAEIVQAEPHPNGDKLLKLQIRLGDRVKQICAGIRAYYRPEDLIGKRVVVVDNLEPRKLRGEMSNGMLLAVRGPEDTLSLVTLDKPDFPTGGQVS
ncbi:MAG: methionine--tRNA ligase subunit beta [Planctomycetota bacterium]|jgi:methionyl-tRNA synthetase|nr:methionine--tRNA ligase subunit beta [Planctomycetota bacterium]